MNREELLDSLRFEALRFTKLAQLCAESDPSLARLYRDTSALLLAARLEIQSEGRRVEWAAG